MKNLPFALLFCASLSSAAADDRTQSYDIPAQSLHGALQKLADQAGIAVFFSDDQVAGKSSPALKGRYSQREALQKLLDGSGLTYRFTAEDSVAIKTADSEGAVLPKPKPGPIKLEPMVVTATKTSRKLSEVPVSTTIVTQKDLQRRAIAVDLSDGLLLEAGLDIARSTPVSPAGFNLRGMGYNRTASLIDGQRSDLMFWSGQHPVQMIDPDNVERVEIVRGAGSALYGPYAMGGVVNIITKEGEGPNKTRLRFGYDSLETPRGGLSTSGSEGWLSYNLNFDHLDSNGYVVTPTPDAFGQMSTEKTDWRQTYGGGKLGFKLSDHAKLAISGSYHNQQTDAGWGRPNTGHNIDQDFENIEYRQKISDSYSFTANFNHTGHSGHYDWDSFNAFYNPSLALTGISEEQVDRYAGQLINYFDFGTDYHVLLGIEYGEESIDNSKYNIIDGQRQIDNTVKSDIANLGVFLQGEAKFFERLSLVAGLRYDYYDYSNNELVDYSTTPPTIGGGDSTFDYVSPRGGINYRLTDATSLRASAGVGFRPPMATDMFRQTMWMKPNPGLQPETSWNVDVGIDHEFDFGLSVSLSGYFSELSDAITWISLPDGRYQPQNVTSAEIKGAELELAYDWQNWSLFANYTYNESKITKDQDPSLIGKFMTKSPAHKVGAGISYAWNERFTGTLLGRYFSRQYADARNSANFIIPEYFVSDLKFNYRQPIGSQALQLTAGINNLFDEKYTRFRKGWYEEPRVYYFQLAYEF